MQDEDKENENEIVGVRMEKLIFLFRSMVFSPQ